MTTKITDHVQRALDALPSQHRDKPNTEAFLTIFAEMIQELEDGVYPLITDRFIDTAVGAQLDVIGKIVGYPRSGLLDEPYRLRLKARIAVNRSSGSLEDLITVALLMLQPETALIKSTMHFPAGLSMDVTDVAVDADTATVVAQFLRDAASAGVQLHVVTSASEDAETLYTSRSAYLSGLTSAGAGSLTVDDTTGFPANGQLRIDTGLAVEEIVTYVSKTSTTFALSGVTASNHEANADVSLIGSRGLGLGDTDDPLVGGDIASVI